MKIIFLLITTQKYHQNRVLPIFCTWAKGIENELFCFTDGDGDSAQFINLHISSDYHSASLKTVLALIHAWNYLGGQTADWVMVSDDDTFVYVDRLREFLRDKDPDDNVCYGNELNHYPPLPNLIYPSGGAGYVLSRRALASLQVPLHQCRLYPFSDVTIGVCMSAAQTRFIATPGFNSQPPEVCYPGVADHEIRNLVPHPITFHYVKPERMFELYRHEYGAPVQTDRPTNSSTS